MFYYVLYKRQSRLWHREHQEMRPNMERAGQACRVEGLVCVAAGGARRGKGGEAARSRGSQSLGCYERVEVCRVFVSQRLPTTHPQEANIALTEGSRKTDYCVRPVT